MIVESENLGRTEVEPCKSTLSAIETEADALVDAFGTLIILSHKNAIWRFDLEQRLATFIRTGQQGALVL